MMGSYTKLYKTKVDIKNYDSMNQNQNYKSVNYDQIKKVSLYFDYIKHR